MPAPITHAVFALEYLKQHPELDERSLLRGTVFPDVRRLAKVDRNMTHRPQATMADVVEQTSSWWVGWWLHSYLDRAWNEFFIARGLVVNPAMNETKWRALKSVEEIKLCEELDDRERLARLFEGPLTPEEQESGIAPEPIQAWYGFTAWLLRHPYDPASWRDRLQAASASPSSEMDALPPLIDEYLHDELWLKRLRELRQELGY